MKIENIKTNINFNARYIGKAEVVQLCKETGKYNPIETSFAEIDTSNRLDINALNKISKIWEELSTNIYHNTSEKFIGNKSYRNIRTFAITKQNDDFEHLDENKILALADVEETIPNKACHLCHIMGDPNYVKAITPEYMGPGTSLMKNLQNIYDHIKLISENNQKTRMFYRKNDFYEHPPKSNRFSWSKDIFSVLGINKK